MGVVQVHWEVDHPPPTTHWVPCQWAFTCSTPEFPRSSLPPSMFHSREERLWTVRQAGPAPQDPARGQYLWMEGSIKVGIPNCKWCPSLAEISIKVSGKFGRQRCCAGSFAYIQYFYCHRVKALLLGAVHLEAEEWKMFHDFSENKGKTARRPNPIISRMASVGGLLTERPRYAFSACFDVRSSQRWSYPLRKS